MKVHRKPLHVRHCGWIEAPGEESKERFEDGVRDDVWNLPDQKLESN